MAVGEEALQGWIGHQHVTHETVSPIQATQLAALFDRGAPPGPGDAVPPLWHWANAFPPRPQSELGGDGHPDPARGSFLPPTALPRRMWAGGKLTFGQPITVGEPLRRTSTIADVATKTGRSGPLVFVRVRHEIVGASGASVTEEQDIVYRDDPQPGQPSPAASAARGDADHEETVVPDAVMLFRYSAATFNGHRIHYDQEYAKSVEGYPGLVVHGPLTATLLISAVARHAGRLPASFAYRGVKPLFCDRPMTVCVKLDGAHDSFECWASDPEGHVGMTGQGALTG